MICKVDGNGQNFATLVRHSWPFQRSSTVFASLSSPPLLASLTKSSNALRGFDVCFVVELNELLN